MPKTRIPSGLLLILLLFSQVCLSHAQSPSKRYPLPVAEVKKIITTLFSSYNLKVQETELESGKIRISASDKIQSWTILIVPYSALGSQVEVVLYQGSESVTEKVQTFWDDIDQFQKEPEILNQHLDPIIPSAILSKISPVVCIRAIIGENNLQFSGFLIDKEGLILSTAHDLKAYEAVKVIFTTGLEYDGEIIEIDMERDLALIKINATHESPVLVEEGRNLLGMGEKIFSIGCPVSLRGTVYPGNINGPPRKADNLPLWQVDMQIMPGSSGSPVFDATGTFVAIVKGRYRGTDRIGFLIPLETILDFLGEIQTL